jgi:hypothetical protein
MDLGIDPGRLLSIYLGIEIVKLIAAKLISQESHLKIMGDISRYQRDSAIILERILSSHDIKPKIVEVNKDETNIP